MLDVNYPSAQRYVNHLENEVVSITVFTGMLSEFP
jgi:hypothetical protein